MAKMFEDARMQAEYERLEKIYRKIPENKFILVKETIRNAAFMAITLRDLQTEVASNGASEEYKNGANQYGKKPSAELQSYNATMKVYLATIKQLDSMLPAEAQVKSSKLEALMDE